MAFTVSLHVIYSESLHTVRIFLRAKREKLTFASWCVCAVSDEGCGLGEEITLL